MEERLSQQLRERIAAQVEKTMLGSLFGASTANSEPQEPLTLDKMLGDMRAMLNSIPPLPLFASSVDYPRDGFWTFDLDGRECVIGHPSLWEKVPSQRSTSMVPAPGSIPIVDTDLNHNRELAAKIRFRIATASYRPGEPVKWPRDVKVPMRPVPTY